MSIPPAVTSRLLIATVGPYRIALELDRIVGLLPASARLAPVHGTPWVLGTVRHQREDIPWISLSQKLGFERRGASGRGFVFELVGTRVAVELDEVIGVTPGEGVGLLPMPEAVSEIPAGNLLGIVDCPGGEALLLRLEDLFTEDDVVEIGGALYS